MKTRMGFALGVVAAAVAVATPAWASSPGENGRIVFQSNRSGPTEIYSMNEDATDVRRLTWNGVADSAPRVSSDGARIVFARTVAGVDQDIWIMSSDGSAERQLTSGSARDDQPVFTEDGLHVVFQRVANASTNPCPCELRIVGADGDGERVLDTGPGAAANPDVSKNGKLVFAGDRDGTRSIYVTNLKGGPVKRVTEGPAAFGDFRPRWSPRGNDIVFMRNELGTLASMDIWRVHQDGTDLRRLTTTARVEDFPRWSPDGERILFAAPDSGPPFGGRLRTLDAEDGSDDRLLAQLSAPFVETFDDGRRDGSLWHEVVDADATIGEVSGRLEATIAGQGIPGGPGNNVSGRWGFQCQLVGDFDYQVGYELLTWPLQGGFFATLSAFDADASVTRSSSPSAPHQWYGGYVPGGASNWVPTTDLAGTLRLVRTGGAIFAYVRGVDEASWSLVFSTTGATGRATIGIYLAAPAEQFGHMDGHVAFDDFRIESGEVSCPTWWRDTMPDWA
jgi:Tol biopolymer transport system component